MTFQRTRYGLDQDTIEISEKDLADKVRSFFSNKNAFQSQTNYPLADRCTGYVVKRLNRSWIWGGVLDWGEGP